MYGFLLALGGGEDASGHIHRPWTQLADRPTAHQEEPGTQHVTLTFIKTNSSYRTISPPHNCNIKSGNRLLLLRLMDQNIIFINRRRKIFYCHCTHVQWNCLTSLRVNIQEKSNRGRTVRERNKTIENVTNMSKASSVSK